MSLTKQQKLKALLTGVSGIQKRKPFTHQLEGISWAAPLDQVGLFWEMRLGKSLVIIRWAEAKGGFPIVIICPRDTIETWQEELAEEGHVEGVEIVTGWSKQPSRTTKWVLTSYESFRENPNLYNFPWFTMILDESTAIKNPKASITKRILATTKRVPYRACLAGHPAPESILEYIPQALFLKGKIRGCKSFWNYRSKYCEPDFSGYNYQPKRGETEKLLTDLSSFSFPLTRKQAGLTSEMLLTSRRVDMPEKYREMYDNVEQFYELPDGTETKFIPSMTTWLARLSGGLHPVCQNDFKVKALQNLLNTDLKNQQVVIWASFQSEIEYLTELLNSKRKKADAIHGKVKPSERQQINNRFQQGKLDYLVCQPKCARFGRNFSAADASIYFSLPRDLLSYLQSRDRVVHPKKTKSTLAVHLLTRDSLDEDIYVALKMKKNSSASIKSLINQASRRRLAAKLLQPEPRKVKSYEYQLES